MGNLHEVSLAEACAQFRQRVATYLADKEARVRGGGLSELEHFPCWYCVKYLDKVPWLSQVPQHSWGQEERHTVERRKDDDMHTPETTPS
jgi:hypothetical protein